MKTSIRYSEVLDKREQKSTTLKSVNYNHDKDLHEIVKQFHRVTRPLFVGTIAMAINRPLEYVEELLQALMEKNVIRTLTHDEKSAKNIYRSSDVYVLIEKPHPSKAEW